MVEFWHLKEWSLDQGLLWSHVSRFFTDERQFWLSGTCYRALGVPFGPLRVWESIVRMLEVDFCVKFSKILIKFQRAFERISYKVQNIDPSFRHFDQHLTLYCLRFWPKIELIMFEVLTQILDILTKLRDILKKCSKCWRKLSRFWLTF